MHSFFESALDLKSQGLGAEKIFPGSIIQETSDWALKVRFLESEGISVSGITKQHSYGISVSGLTQDRAMGYGIEGQVIESIRVQYMGIPHQSRTPENPQLEKPGLPFVPHHTMILFPCFDTEKGGYEGPFYLPSSQIGFFMADNTNFQYAQGAFDGLTAFYTPSGKVSVFRVEAMAERFAQSARAVGLPSLDPVQFKSAIINLCRANLSYLLPDKKLYIRPCLVGTRGGLAVQSAQQCLVAFEVCAYGSFFQDSIKIEGLLDIYRPITGADKVAGNYTDSFWRKKVVKSRGYQDYLSFDAEGFAEEATTCAIGFFSIRDGQEVYIFSPVREDHLDNGRTYNSLDSITRRSVIELLRASGKTVEIRDVHFSEIAQMYGMFTMGNAAGITRISEIALRKFSGDSEILNKKFDQDSFLKSFLWLKSLLAQARSGCLEDERLLRFNTEWITFID